jgi:hypothetical protein
MSRKRSIGSALHVDHYPTKRPCKTVSYEAQQDEPPSLSQLPIEMQECILSFAVGADQAQLLQLMRVCKLWAQVLSNRVAIMRGALPAKAFDPLGITPPHRQLPATLLGHTLKLDACHIGFHQVRHLVLKMSSLSLAAFQCATPALLVRLRSLALLKCVLYDVDQLPAMPNLSVLDLSDSIWDDGHQHHKALVFPWSTRVPNLVHFTAQRCQDLDNKFLSGITQLPRVRRIDVRDTSVVGSSTLRLLSKLRNRSTPIEVCLGAVTLAVPAAVHEFGGCMRRLGSSLQMLKLQDCMLSLVHVQAIAEHCTALRTLDLSNNHSLGAGVFEVLALLKCFATLQRVFLHRTRVACNIREMEAFAHTLRPANLPRALKIFVFGDDRSKMLLYLTIAILLPPIALQQILGQTGDIENIDTSNVTRNLNTAM